MLHLINLFLIQVVESFSGTESFTSPSTFLQLTFASHDLWFTSQSLLVGLHRGLQEDISPDHPFFVRLPASLRLFHFFLLCRCLGAGHSQDNQPLASPAACGVLIAALCVVCTGL